MLVICRARSVSNLAEAYGIYAELYMYTASRLGWVVVLASIQMLAQQYPFVRVPGSPNETGHLFEDSRSRLWVEGEGGLWCFDGSTFYRVRGLPAGGHALSEDHHGGIWIASGGALYRYSQGQSQYIAKGIAMSAVTLDAATELVSMKSAPDDDSWLTRVQQRHGSWNLEPIVNLHSRGALAADSRGMLTYRCRDAWCETSLEDLKHWHPGLEVQVIRHPTSAPARFGATKVIRDRLGCVWVRAEIDARYRCPADLTLKSLPYEIASENVNADISEADDGSIIITSNASLAVGRPGRFLAASAANGLP